MTEQNLAPTFDQAVLPHLDAAYNLARWLTRNQQDAEDMSRRHTYALSDSFPASAAAMHAYG